MAALLGALVGGAISLIVSTRAARTERRARYGESLLNALAAAERRLASATEPEHHGPVLLEPILLREDAIAVWSRAELASTLESPAGQKAMRAWGLQLFGDIVHGASNDAQMTWLFVRAARSRRVPDHRLDGRTCDRPRLCAPWHRDRKDVRPRTRNTRHTRLRSTSKADVTKPVNPDPSIHLVSPAV